MSYIFKIPSSLYLLIIYNLIAFAGDTNLLEEQFMQISMLSGAELSLTNSHLLLLLGIIALYVEVFKSTRTSMSSMIEQGFSMLVFVAFLVEFLMVSQAGTATFLLLTMMQLMDVMSGLMVSVSTARRDISMGGG